MDANRALCELHIRQSRAHIVRQHEIIVETEQAGRDATLARLLLHQFEWCLINHKTHLTRLEGMRRVG